MVLIVSLSNLYYYYLYLYIIISDQNIFLLLYIMELIYRFMYKFENLFCKINTLVKIE